jgi:hypothetical protein
MRRPRPELPEVEPQLAVVEEIAHGRPRLVKSRRVDPVCEAVASLSAHLPKHAQTQALADLLEDELREAMHACSELQTHFDEVLSTLVDRPGDPLALLEAGDDGRAQDAIDRLSSLAGLVRRRLGSAAAKVQRTARTPTLEK